MKSLAPLLLLSALAACGGGGSSAPSALPAPVATAAPTAPPSPAPSASASPHATITPSPAPSASASPIPTATPTIAAALRVIGGAPLTATASQLSTARRTAQAKTEAQGVENGLPVLVESSGAFALEAGTFANWVTNVQNAANIPETSGQITTTGGLLIDNPGFSQACLASIAPACVVHPTAWEFGTDSGQTKPLGKQTITITYGDGMTGSVSDYVYNGWGLQCGQGWAYIAGAVVVQPTQATSDVYADCVHGNIVFTQGAVQIASPQQDQYGRYETIFPTVTAAFIENSLFTNAPMPSIAQGAVFGIITRDGGFAKVYFTSGAGVPGSPTGISAEGMALHANADGSYPY